MRLTSSLDAPARGRLSGRPARGLVLLAILALLPATQAVGAGRTLGDGLAPARPSPSGAERLYRADRVEVHLAVPDPGDTLKLPHGRVSPASLLVRLGDRLFLSDVDYRLLHGAGEIVWLTRIRAGERAGPSPALSESLDAQRGPPPAAPDSLVVVYRYLPLPLAGFWGRTLADRPETLAASSLPVAPDRSLPPGARLDIGGSKTFSVEFGNRRDAKLEQSLDLVVRGQLAENVKVRAVLTDRATPLQPEGTTAELSDLDQVLIEVDAPGAALRLGDVAAEQRGFTFVQHRREMEGLTVRAGKEGGARGTGAFGRGLGRHLSVEFFAEDGKQGPYRLLTRLPDGNSGERRPGEDAIVVAASERVWLDGVRLQRGEDADYTIDYDSGELWFTPRRPVGSVSEVRVDLQVREGAFDRDYTALTAASSDSAALGLAVAWVREEDDADRSAATGLTDAEADLLRLAGDRADAIGGGVVPDSLGDYALVEADSVETPFFLFVGEELDAQRYGARYQVAFTDVGEGEGDYTRTVSSLGATYYLYAGRKRGRYLPGRRLPLPERRDVVAVRAGGAVGAGLSVRAEGALSQYDRNTLSSIDDADNQGGALSVQGDWLLARLWGGRPDLLQLNFQARDVERDFSSPERLSDPFEYRRWNASADSVLDGRDRRGVVGLVVRPWSGASFAGDWEQLAAPGGFAGDRWHVGAARRGKISVDADLWEARTEEAGTPGRTRRIRSNAGWNGAWGLGAGFESEELLRGGAGRRSGTAFDRVVLNGRLAPVLAGLRASVQAELRRDYVQSEGAREREATSRVYRTDVSYLRGATIVQTMYSRRERDETAGGPKATTDLADWAVSHRGMGTRWTGEWRGRVTAAESRLRREVLRHVGGEAGHYDSLGRYTGRGAYELYYEPGDSTALETHLESLIRLSGRPFSSGSSDEGLLAGLETTLFGRLEASTDLRLASLLSDPHALWGGGESIRDHDRTLRGDLSWSGAPDLPVPALRLEGRRGRERTALGALRMQDADQRTVEVRWTVRRGLRSRIEYAWEREGESIAWAQSGVRSFDERTTGKLAGEANWSVFDPLDLRVQGEAQKENYRPSAETRRLYRAIGGVILEPVAATRIEVTVEKRWVDRELAGASPFWIDRPGWRVTCTGSLRPKPGFSGSLWVRFDQEDGRDAVVTGRMEARAYF